MFFSGRGQVLLPEHPVGVGLNLVSQRSADAYVVETLRLGYAATRKPAVCLCASYDLSQH